MPAWMRRLAIHVMAPSFSVGTMCVIMRADGARLFVRHSYRGQWGVPGGLLKRGEDMADGAVRETREEAGLDVVLDGQPFVVVYPKVRRVDIIFRARPADPARTEVAATSPEILEARWFLPDEPLPPLQTETARAVTELTK
jgi:ADP-ribose pyrophosphatase YjhB (NUDIX family)